LLYWVVRLLLWGLFRPLFRLRCFGKQNVPLEGGVLIASNHQSFLDPMLIGTPILHRQISYMARDTLFEVPGLGRLISAVNAFPVNREGGDLEAVKLTIEKLRAGEAVLLFPEGTRTHDGQIGPIRPGAAMIASRAQVPILPAVVHGAFEAWPRTARFPRPGNISVAFGKTIPPPGNTRGERRAASELLSSRLCELQQMLRSLE